ncbi:SF1B family DNA helicase RecD2 [Pseudodesulfovibrio pelocollis]|uniref:SF1B family DNA helicase RecD2 n=1 Tax=Pseudodesulfovibrio pelocollis TaxID=3051432 RepID=UPI00255B38DF|nr:ATP-dependent RecD-like DNA helicase [Pseudodesulfovibrio sp. SB368]
MSEAPLEKCDVVVRKVVFHNPDNAFTIARVFPEGSTDPSRDWFTVKGNMGRLHEDERVVLTGAWGELHPKFGRAFEVTAIELPDFKQGGVDVFLQAGFLKGIGPALGKRIYEAFGPDIIDILDNDPRRLLEVSGIGEKKIEDIKRSWTETRSRREALSFFSKWNVRPRTISKILERWPNVRDAIQTVKDNPYILAWEIRGVGFALADKIAYSMGIPEDSKKRIEAAIGYTLDMAALNQGHCYLPREELIERTADFLKPLLKNAHSQITFDSINESIELLAIQQKLVIEGIRVFLKPIHATEKKLAVDLRRLRDFHISIDSSKADVAITDFEKKNGFSLHENQREAVKTAVLQKVAVITGGPGTGKTTIIKCILFVCERLEVGTVRLVAPTGKAAQRMRESCGKEASTIHRLLGAGQGGVLHNEKNLIKAAMLICDESSMVDVYLGKSLFCALPDATRVVLVGDIDQLPPVRAGNVLKDIITSRKIPVVYLTKVYRQSDNSFIPDNAQAVLAGKARALKLKEVGDDSANDDSFYMPVPMSVEEQGVKRELETEERAEIARRLLINAVMRLLVKGYEPKDIMVLSPAKKGRVGVESINQLMQGLLNSTGCPVGNTPFRVGDRVMQTKNNYEKDVFNGDQGYIQSFDSEGQTVRIEFEGRRVDYELEALSEITWAYCITVHKAQGMESSAVIQFVSISQSMMLNRNILYTGITRAKKFCLLIGERKALGLAVWKNDSSNRNTTLAEKI